MFLAAAACFPIWGQVTEGQPIPTTQSLQTRLEAQLERNDQSLKQALSAPDTSLDFSIETITGRTGPLWQPRSRDLEGGAAPSGPTALNIPLTPDVTLKAVGTNQVPGFILTGKWISDYARMIKLQSEYEKALAGYRSQAELQKQLVAELEGVVEVKDKKIQVLEEMNSSLEARGDMYKRITELQGDPWYSKMLRKLAFPAGLALGIFVGVEIANNN